MDRWLKKSHDNRTKRIADDVEAAVNTNANGYLQTCLRFVRIGYRCLVVIFLIE